LLTPGEIADPTRDSGPGTTAADVSAADVPAPAGPETAASSVAAPGAGQKPPRRTQTARQAPGPARTRAPRSSHTAQASPPLPGYDTLSLASLRARLRNLDVDQLRALISYERSNAGRTEVLTMFERRIAKLDSQS
jgi:hypothetical protein